jgi:hypothetical protein
MVPRLPAHSRPIQTAAVANVHHPGSFQALFLANAASCLIFAAVLTVLTCPLCAPRPQGKRREPATGTC